MTSVFAPSLAYVTDITNAQYAVVTFSDDHSYVDGEIVSFRVSRDSGMWEINNKQARVLSHTDDTITVELDTSSFTPFVDVADIQRPAITVPSASGITPLQYVPTVTLEDAFDNIPV